LQRVFRLISHRPWLVLCALVALTLLAAVPLVDGEAHHQWVSTNQETSQAYLQAIEPLKKFQTANPDVRFVYTCISVTNRVYFVLDPTPPGDWDGDGLDDKSHIMQGYAEASPALREALRTGQARADVEPYTDPWGTFLSGYAPLRDAQGNQAGALGVDLQAEDYLQRLVGMKQAAGCQALDVLAVPIDVARQFREDEIVRFERSQS